MKGFTRFLLLASTLIFAGGVLADPVWIDVRGDDEFARDHIEGDTHVPLATLDPADLASRFGKDAQINLYCRSGNRAGQARQILEEAGFTNVTNTGGIDDVRELRALARSSDAD